MIIHRADPQATEAIVEHYFGGNSKGSRIPIREGALHLALRERDETGSPIEWMEVNVKA